jgi:large subunit ribosomal protein L5
MGGNVVSTGESEPQAIPRMKDKYIREVVPQLMKEFGYKNLLEAPRLEKIVVNMGLGDAIQNIKTIDHASEELGLITGQKPIVTRARKSISNFKLRAGMPIGCSVTLRRQRMYEFLDRLINIALPRVRDFRGISGKAFDGRGNYTMGIREQIIFPEINYDKIDKIRGMNVTIVTTAKTDEEAKAFLKHMGMPFRN